MSLLMAMAVSQGAAGEDEEAQENQGGQLLLTLTSDQTLELPVSASSTKVTAPS